MTINLNLPKSLEELSTIDKKTYSTSDWSGAVNMLLVENSLVLIKRSETMPSHKGQIGFFGGHKKVDELNPVDTALREFEEETHISREKVRVIGIIEPTRSRSHYSKLIMPVLCEFIGSVDELRKSVRSNGEWSDMVITPLDYLKQINNWEVAQNMNTGQLIGFCPLTRKESQFLTESTALDYVLWGASAKMIWNFFNCYK